MIARRENVKNFILSEKLDVICLEESKLSFINDQIIKEIVGTGLDSRTYILANGITGRVIMAWKSSLFEDVSRQVHTHVLTIDIRSRLDNTVYRITRVYEPSTHVNHDAFFTELSQAKPSSEVP
jgi:hypothetical protein